jgi:hypothetical protein
VVGRLLRYLIPQRRRRVYNMNTDTKKNYRTLTKCDSGKLYKVIEYDSGTRVEIPINRDGSVKWFDDSKLLKKSAKIER